MLSKNEFGISESLVIIEYPIHLQNPSGAKATFDITILKANHSITGVGV